MSPQGPHKPGSIPPPPQPPPKPGIMLRSDPADGDLIELRIKPEVSLPMYVAWLASDEQRDAYAAWLAAR